MQIEESTIFYLFCLIQKVQHYTMPGNNNESIYGMTMHSVLDDFFLLAQIFCLYIYIYNAKKERNNNTDVPRFCCFACANIIVEKQT